MDLDLLRYLNKKKEEEEAIMAEADLFYKWMDGDRLINKQK